MDRKKVFPLILTGAILLMAVLGAVTYGPVYAQTPEATPTGKTSEARVPGPQKGPRGDFMGGYTDEELASAIGIEVSALQTAQKTAQDEALKQAVNQGLITQEQVDQIAKKGFNRFFLAGQDPSKTSSINYDALLAKALNITEENLKAAYEKAEKAHLASEVANGAITQEQADLQAAQKALRESSSFQSNLQTAYQSAYQSAINQAVKDGVITQAQADLLIKQNKAFDGFGPGRPGDSLSRAGRPEDDRGNHLPPAKSTPPAPNTAPESSVQ